ncbi:MAG: asparagine synthase-related protein [Coriobacteriia bacterium]|nr:asparagine synthase-related protein [Coriobacteriia bacterium]
MSGIAGYFGIVAPAGLTDQSDSFEQQEPPGLALLQRMNRFQAHRGPDGEGFFLEQQVGLAHRRLVIIDEAGGDQPMFSADGRFVLSMSGMIYNYLELRDELVALGHSFTTESDAEVVLAAFSEWGKDCFEMFNGMWGMAIYDRVDERLTLSRDHFGIKPLYYAPIIGSVGAQPEPSTNDTTEEGLQPEEQRLSPALIFSSELKPIVFSGLIERRANDRSVYRYLRFRLHDDNSETFFDGVYQLLGGQALEIDAQGTRVFYYTTIIDELIASSERRDHAPYTPETAKQYYQLLKDSVGMRLRSDRTIGSALSGGMDSTTLATIVTTLMEKNPEMTTAVGEKQKTFSAVFPGSINNEEEYIDAFLRMHQGKIEPFKDSPQVDEFVADFDDFIYTIEQPIISTGPYAQYHMLRLVAQNVESFLTGAGPDEMMAGYVPYYAVYLRQLKARRQYLRLIREGFASFDKIFRLLRVRFTSRLFGKKAWDDRLFISTDFANRFAGERYQAVQDNLKLRLVYDLTAYSAPCVARYEDRSAMRFSLEGRLPFVNKDLVRFIWAQSDEALIHGSWNKRMLRDAMLPYLPKEVANRRNKIGFSTPEIEWFGYMKDKYLDIFQSDSFAERPYFNAAVAREAFQAYYDGTGDATTLSFWRMIHLELWLRMFIDAPLPETPDEPPHPRGGELRNTTQVAPPIVITATVAPPEQSDGAGS